MPGHLVETPRQKLAPQSTGSVQTATVKNLNNYLTKLTSYFTTVEFLRTQSLTVSDLDQGNKLQIRLNFNMAHCNVLITDSLIF